MEAADGFWKWDSLVSGRHYQILYTDCYQSPPTWAYFNKSNALYKNDPSILANENPEGDGVSFHFRYFMGNGFTTRDTTVAKWWSLGEKEPSYCEIGKDRIFTNKKEVYSSGEFAGNRYSPWVPGYNEIFSPYSSPSTTSWNDQQTGIFMWHRSMNGAVASSKIYRASENGGSTPLSTILEETPPSRPMNIKIEDCGPIVNNYYRIKLTWNHNMEPDMKRPLGVSFNKRYKIYRSKSNDMTIVPPDKMLYPEHVY